MAKKEVKSSNVKSFKKYRKFGEVIRYLTPAEYQKFMDTIEDLTHKLMMRIIFETGCRVGEFVRIQTKHLIFSRNSIYFPSTNTKTRESRTSWIPKSLMNDIKDYLRRTRRMAKRKDTIKNPEDFLFKSNRQKHLSENRVRQIFRKYIIACGLDREYGVDTKNRVLHVFTIHSLRHAHINFYINNCKVPVTMVQKQVGHRRLQTTLLYAQVTDGVVAEIYQKARSEYSHMIEGQNTLS